MKRMKNILIVLFIILLNILNPQYLLAIDLKFNRLTAENGLPYSTANVMLQDDNGFLWIGTHTGLCRYDGINTEIYSEFENRFDLWKKRKEIGYGSVWRMGLPVLI